MLRLLVLSVLVIKWIENFSSGLYMYVRINNYVSNMYWVKSDVLQRSYCGPILFNLFVNYLNCCILKFECTFIIISNCWKSLKMKVIVSLQNYLYHIIIWSELSALYLIVKKSFIISFSRNNIYKEYRYKMGSANLRINLIYTTY